ncbi:hypothetical protein E1A91_A12G162500v1 [Gossypium mustelinum]|uniref:Stress-associated endoplasmic reticulum protein n=1 Tax=Gossypium mustelinum TaxID=34275 RepID=A0A5D2WWH8_GOSMU|nr:hypothetical protein E1A91_A12G162500v1 [Gossypium mustelinum]
MLFFFVFRFPPPLKATTSRRLAERKVEKFQKNITKRGVVSETSTKKGKDYPVGPVLLGFFVFVVIGSYTWCTALGACAWIMCLVSLVKD